MKLSEAMPGPWSRSQRALALMATALVTFCVFDYLGTAPSMARGGPVDPGPRGGVSAGGPLPGLTADELAFFNDGLARFEDTEVVTGGSNNGLGPRFNSNQCASCHSQPAIGGTSPANNPLIAVANLDGALNRIPWFITPHGPIREARFKSDGGVHDLFTITGRADALGCNLAQPDFQTADKHPNVSFRIPTPVFGAGLIEAIPDDEILAITTEDASLKQQLGISGHPNRSGNDGTITRFGWKAQNKSLLMFAGEAYNVEMGVTNQLFPQERDETPGCLFNPTPEDTSNFEQTSAVAVLSDVEAFANFMRMLAPPKATFDFSGISKFGDVGCATCHVEVLVTGKAIASGSGTSPSASLSNQQVYIFSDLLLHHMGKGLADGITQGLAGPDEFRTAPLWGLGQRLFFLHDGRTSNLVEAIKAHKSRGSEANRVIENFERLPISEQQAIIDFLRSL